MKYFILWMLVLNALLLMTNSNTILNSEVPPDLSNNNDLETEDSISKEPCTVVATPTGYMVDCNEAATVRIEHKSTIDNNNSEVDDANYVIQDPVESTFEVRRKVKVCHKNRVKFVTLQALAEHVAHGDGSGPCVVKDK